MSNFCTLIDALEDRATTERQLTFIEGKEKESTISFMQLHQNALAMLYHFQQKGLKPGDQLIIFLRNNECFLDAFWGAILGGIIPVPIAVGISDEHRSKLFKIFSKLNNPFIFTDEDNLQRLKKYAEDNGLSKNYSELERASITTEKTNDLQKAGIKHKAEADDICFIQFSSGSTSEPKGVVLTHRNLILNVLAKAKAGGYTDKDIALSWMPLTHDMGLIGFHINMVVCNMNHHIMSTDLFSRRPNLWLQKVSEKQASVICSPNFGYKHFLKSMGDKEFSDMDLSCVRVILNGAEPISTRLCDEFLERMSAYGLSKSSMLPVYGLAEATLAVAFPKYEQPYRAVHVDRHKIKVGDIVSYIDASNNDAVSFPIVGFAVPNIEIRIGDIDGAVYEDNIIGSILIKGPTVTQGYYDDKEASNAVMSADGWLDTGDLGFIFKKELVITGRSKEIIFAHGQNYYPHDLESILIHSLTIELGKVAVYGIWDETQQRDKLLVFVIYRGAIEEFLPISKSITATLNEQAGLEVDHVIPVIRIPKTTSGKFQRRILADAFVNGEYDNILSEFEKRKDVAINNDSYEGTELQRDLINICNTVLEDTKLSLHDNFFETGISSLALAEMHQSIDDKYPDVVDITDLFEYQTIQMLAEFIQDKVVESVPES